MAVKEHLFCKIDRHFYHIYDSESQHYPMAAIGDEQYLEWPNYLLPCREVDHISNLLEDVSPPWVFEEDLDVFSSDLKCGWKEDLMSLFVCKFTLNTPHALLSASSLRLALDMRILRKQKSQAWSLLDVKYVLGIKGCHQPNPGWVRITLSKTGPTINRI